MKGTSSLQNKESSTTRARSTAILLLRHADTETLEKRETIFLFVFLVDIHHSSYIDPKRATVAGELAGCLADHV